jgi:hypothetical protein
VEKLERILEVVADKLVLIDGVRRSLGDRVGEDVQRGDERQSDQLADLQVVGFPDVGALDAVLPQDFAEKVEHHRWREHLLRIGSRVEVTKRLEAAALVIE